MPRTRSTKGLAKRISLDYFQRPHWLRTLRSGLAWGCATLAAFVGIGIVAGPAGHAVVPGPVSRAHAFIESDCARCHAGAAFGTTGSFAGSGGPAGTGAPMDRACGTCHDGAIHQAKQTFTPACADCHAGHRGRAALEVRDAACVRCHSKSVIGFGEGEHPEFAPLRAGTLDAARLRLNHAAHLVVGLRGPDGPVTLRCDSCHRPDAAGGLMLPVTYGQHCASCHPLAFDSAGRFPPGTAAPHARPEIVRAFLENLYQAEISRHPERLGEPMPDRRSPPGDDAPATIDVRPARTNAEWIEREVGIAEEILLRKDCRLCHRFEEAAILPTAVPRVWLTRARFDHRGHRLLACTACHDRAKSSQETSDILLPAIATCRSCHRPEAGRTDCALCHLYHDRTRERGFDGPLGLTLEVAKR